MVELAVVVTVVVWLHCPRQSGKIGRKIKKKDTNSESFSMNYKEVTWKEEEPDCLVQFLIVMKVQDPSCAENTDNSDIHVHQDSQGSKNSEESLS